MSPTMLDAALAYAARGWAVFPCIPGQKEPLTAHGCKDATTDLERLRAWWAEHPAANIGCAAGAISGLTVFDVDMKQDKDGGTSLLALIAKNGALPETLRQRTQSGG